MHLQIAWHPPSVESLGVGSSCAHWSSRLPGASQQMAGGHLGETGYGDVSVMVMKSTHRRLSKRDGGPIGSLGAFELPENGAARGGIEYLLQAELKSHQNRFERHTLSFVYRYASVNIVLLGYVENSRGLFQVMP